MCLPPRCVEATLEILLESRVSVTDIFLRSRILSSPLVAGLGHGDLGAALLARSTASTTLSGNGADELSESHHLVQDHAAHLTNILNHLKVEVEGGGAVGLVRGVVPDVQVGVLKSLLHADTGRGVKGEHLVEKIEGVWVGLGEQAGERFLGHEWQVAHVFLGSGRSNARERLLVGGSEDVEDLVQLVNVVAALEEGSAAQQLSQNTANRPNINYSS